MCSADGCGRFGGKIAGGHSVTLPAPSGESERAWQCMQGEHLVRCATTGPTALVGDFGGLQQFATQTLRVHCTV